MVGKYLRDQREIANLTREELVKKTNIRLDYIKALENDCFDKVPADIYVRGYLKSYLLAIDVSPDEALRLYEEYKSQNEPVPDNYEADFNLPQNRRYPYLNYVFSFFIIAVSVVLFIYSTDMFSSKEQDTEYLEFSLYDSNADSSFGNKEDGVLYKPISINAGYCTNDETYAYKDTKFDLKRGKTISTKPNYMSVPPVEDHNRYGNFVDNNIIKTNGKEYLLYAQKKHKRHEGLEAAIHEQHILKINAIKKTWVTVQIDRKNKMNFLLKPGESRTFAADEFFELSIGNAGAIKLIFNEMELSNIGGSGEVVTLKLP